LDYSQEQKETMFKNILAYVADTKAEEGVNAKIHPDTIHRLVGIELDEDRVILHREELNKNFGYLSASYGFRDFYDFYLYAMACEAEEPLVKGIGKSYNKITRTITRNDKPIQVDFYTEGSEYEPVEKSGGRRQKDYSKLKQVKRTVTRNGKPTEMTFYEDPNKDSDDGAQGGGGEEEDTSPKPVDAKELRKASVGAEKKKVSMKELNALKDMHSAIGGQGEFSADSEVYQVLADENNNIMGMVGFNYDSEYVTLTFGDSNELVNNFDVRLFMELVNEGLRRGLGIRTKHLGTRTFDILVEDHEMNIPDTVDGYYTQEKDKLLDAYGYGD